jgi:hypothetical protein
MAPMSAAPMSHDRRSHGRAVAVTTRAGFGPEPCATASSANAKSRVD